MNDNPLQNKNDKTALSNIKYELSQGLQILVTISAGANNWSYIDGSYRQNIPIIDILEIDYPVVDVYLSKDYKLAMEEINNYSHINKILTYDGYIVVYSDEVINIDLNIIMKVNR